MDPPGGSPATFRFGPYEADARARELRKRGLRIKLRDKSFEMLVALLERAGGVVTRDELRRRLWPEGVFVDFDNSLNSTVNRLRGVLGDSPARPRFIETLPRVGYRFIGPLEPVRAARPTLAVLPFENLNHDPEQDYFADGVADALTTVLGNVSTLRVISRQSVLHFRGTQRTIAEIARQLKADAIVEGSVLRAGGRARITAQLVQVAPEQHLWARSFECEIGDILAIQGDVARAIAEAVQVALTPAEIGRLGRSRRVDPEAHLAYLKARHYTGRWSREGFQKGLQYFHLAIEKDPTHALAYARLADCYALLGFWGHLPIGEAYPRAREAALQALALDDTLSTAHWALGWVRWMQDWDLPGCEAACHRAIQLNPSDEGAHVLYAVFLGTTGRDRAKAVAEAELAVDLDPLSLYVNTSAAWIRLFVEDYEGAAERARRTLDMFPGALHAYYVLGLAQVGLSRYAEAIGAFEKALAISPDVVSLGYLGNALGRAGHVARAVSILQDLLSRREREHVPIRSFVLLYAGLGEWDRAFEWLEKAYRDRDPMLFWLRAGPGFQPLRSDPRFDEMLRRIGLSH